MQDELIASFKAQDAHVAVIGLGYVGLPLAVSFAQAGLRVTGIDLDRRKVEAINDIAVLVCQESAVDRVAAGSAAGQAQPAPQAAHQPTAHGAQPRLSATMDYAVLAECDAVSICVPTPLNKTGDPDISYIASAAEAVARYLHRGMVVVLESTTYPGTTTEVLLPKLEENGMGLRVGEDFFLAFSPERVDPGRQDWTTRNTPKVIGGVTPACLAVATAFYSQAIETLVPVSSPSTAEMVKLFENTFRSVNIGLANELLLMCDKLNLDAWEVIEAAATKPFGFMKFTPGPGLGGHCIPIDPLYLSWKLRSLQYNARFIELASEINTEMPRYWVQRAQDALNEVGKALKGSQVLVLGVAYKKNVSDMRESPALDIIHLLESKGAQVSYHDPHVPAFQHDGMEMVSVSDLASALGQADCVVLATDHSAYDWSVIAGLAKLVVDTRH
ncbi:MAG TPA: nucleotide sugar dehydrogenase, partial [Caldilineaceae bacterium]|nr:nucleotide sugar dehydrogenase [Caldilineaceae bacterium]